MALSRMSIMNIKVENDTESKEGSETGDNKQISYIGATFDEDVKPFGLEEIPNKRSLSLSHKDGLHNSSGFNTETNFKADVKEEKPSCDDDVKSISLNEIQDMISSSRQFDRLNDKSSSSSRRSDHEILGEKETSESQCYITTCDFKPVTEPAPISSDETMQAACFENQFKDEPTSRIEPPASVDPIVIHSSADHIVAGNIKLENDIAGRPCCDTPWMKTETRDDDSQNYSNDFPSTTSNDKSAVIKERLKMELGQDNDDIVENQQSKQSSGVNGNTLNHVNDASSCNAYGKDFSAAQFFSRYLKDIHTDQDQDVSKKSQAHVNGDKCHLACRCFDSNQLYTQFDTHLRTHVKEKPFKCDRCHKSYSQNSHLQDHMMKHTGERPFECDICDKSFTRKSHLNRHTRTHKIEEKFKCDQCYECFSDTSTLRKHMRTHIRQRLLKCTWCHGSIKSSSHFDSHTEEKPFKCDQCFKSFSKFSNLDRHMRTHTGERPFKCHQCQKNFSVKCSLQRHMMRAHGRQDIQM